MSWDTVQQLLRIILQVAAGFVVGQGYLNAEMATTATGAIMSLAGVIWWAVWNNKKPAS